MEVTETAATSQDSLTGVHQGEPISALANNGPTEKFGATGVAELREPLTGKKEG